MNFLNKRFPRRQAELTAVVVVFVILILTLFIIRGCA